MAVVVWQKGCFSLKPSPKAAHDPRPESGSRPVALWGLDLGCSKWEIQGEFSKGKVLEEGLPRQGQGNLGWTLPTRGMRLGLAVCVSSSHLALLEDLALCGLCCVTSSTAGSSALPRLSAGPQVPD